MTNTSRANRKDFYQVCFLGDSFVGKTCLLKRFYKNSYDESTPIGTCANYFERALEVNGTRITLAAWDPPGERRFRSILPLYLRNCDGCILIYDVTTRESLNHLPSLVEVFKQDAPDDIIVYVVGNKCDMLDNREIASDEGKQFADRHGFSYIETSAKTAENVTGLFTAIAKELEIRAAKNTDRRFTIRNVKEKKPDKCC